jgi:hypothetical protein
MQVRTQDDTPSLHLPGRIRLPGEVGELVGPACGVTAPA